MQMLQLFSLHGLQPEYFCDSDASKQGTKVGDIYVIPPSKISEIRNVVLVATLSCPNDIRSILCDLHIEIKCFIDGSSIYSIGLITLLYQHNKNRLKTGINKIYRQKSVFDFTYGMELGGVQTWCYDQSTVMKNMDILVRYIMPDNRLYCHDENVDVITGNKVSICDNRIDSYVKYFLATDAKYIIINFPREIMIAACVVKKLYKPGLYIVAIIHNDEAIYYKTYYDNADLIDVWGVISEETEKKVKALGIEEERIHRFNWKAKVAYSQREDKRLRIGYAGRIVIPAKRIDYILDVAEILKNKQMDYLLQVAGTGESEEYLIEEIEKRGLEKNVEFLGLVNHEMIFEFWKKQHIYLACSDHEGHSISQFEAMSVGAVPVVTDTSGARDDIADGENGFVLPLGAINDIAEKVEYLDEHRDILEVMSKRCVDTIAKKSDNVDELNDWKQVLGIL